MPVKTARHRLASTPDAIAFNPNTAARRVGISRSKIFEAIKEGHLDARKFGRRTVITEDALRAFLAALPSA